MIKTLMSKISNALFKSKTIDKDELFKDSLSYIASTIYTKLEDEKRKNKCLKYLFEECHEFSYYEDGDNLYFECNNEYYHVSKFLSVFTVRHVSKYEMEEILI